MGPMSTYAGRVLVLHENKPEGESACTPPSNVTKHLGYILFTLA